MKKITPIEQLQESILLLEAKQLSDEAQLKAQFKETFESLKPISLIKSTLSDIADSNEIKENFIDTSISLIAGYLSKKIAFGSTHNPLKQVIGSLIQVGVTSLVSKKADDIRSFASRIMDNFLPKNDKPD